MAAGVLAPGVLFRSGQPQTWQPEAWQQAYEAGVRHIVDLRHPSEPRGEISGNAQIDYCFAPVEDPRLPEFRSRFVPYLNHTSDYPDFLDMFADKVAVAIATVLRFGPGTLVCCSAGRDRTGLVMGILLRALGATLSELLLQDELAVRAVNEHHRVRATPHPYERWQDEYELEQTIASRAAGLEQLFWSFNPGRFCRANGIPDELFAQARSWLVVRQ